LYTLHVLCVTSRKIRQNADDLDNCHSNIEVLKPGG